MWGDSFPLTAKNLFKTLQFLFAKLKAIFGQ